MAAMPRLHALGWGVKRLAKELDARAQYGGSAHDPLQPMTGASV
jgi:hypothetical protein